MQSNDIQKACAWLVMHAIRWLPFLSRWSKQTNAMQRVEVAPTLSWLQMKEGRQNALFFAHVQTIRMFAASLICITCFEKIQQKNICTGYNTWMKLFTWSDCAQENKINEHTRIIPNLADTLQIHTLLQNLTQGMHIILFCWVSHFFVCFSVHKRIMLMCSQAQYIGSFNLIFETYTTLASINSPNHSMKFERSLSSAVAVTVLNPQERTLGLLRHHVHQRCCSNNQFSHAKFVTGRYASKKHDPHKFHLCTNHCES